MFEKIASYHSFGDLNVKKVFMTKFFKANWLNAYMFCEKHGMELLRIENYAELLKVKRALKIHWLDFDHSLHIDGTRLIDKKWRKLESWEFLSTGKIMDLSVINDIVAEHNDWNRINENDNNCLSIGKSYLEPRILIANCRKTNNDFLCQKTTKNDYESVENNDDGPIKIDVRSRIFDKIGTFHEDFEHSTYFVNRLNYNLSPIMASSFCEHFNMKLLHIRDQEQLNHLFKLLIKQDRNDYFYFEHHANAEHFLPEREKKKCLELTTLLDEKGLGKMVYSKCDGEKKSFICEDKLKVQQQFDYKIKTNGMKFLGTFERGRYNYNEILCRV